MQPTGKKWGVLFVSVWPHWYLFYTLDYNSILSDLFILLLSVFQIWLLEALSGIP